MPMLKQPGSAQRKKRSPRSGAPSISAPLGDFRHTLHVGRGGDAFGDTSFLSLHGAEPAAEPQAPPARTPPPAPAAPPDPLLSFHLDLGPSMLDAVLGVMDAGGAGAADAQTDAHARSGAQPRRAPRLELDRGLGL
ncbi:cdc42 effector protein 5 [Octodon degus]|uniref:Cdc42 effector protein 5 n=1 Tax=Octodon degus TaxID=10160 RepID=A0A6P3FYQ9_OCTDE|nr:cdc42 effector protein 5 [Octodon degus]XP_023564314.1 cdc42 effector protein 5 [Octodon degus]